MTVGIVGLTATCARMIGGFTSGLVAGLMAALYLPFAWGASVSLSDLFGTLLMAAAVLFSIRLLQSGSRRWIWAASLGATSAVLALTRPAYALWLFVPLGLLVLEKRLTSDTLRTIGIVLGVAALVMTPWWIRNAVTMNEVILLSSNSGAALLDSVGGGPLSEDEQRVADAAEGAGADPIGAAANHRIRRLLRETPSLFIANKSAGVWRMVSVPWNPPLDTYWDETYNRAPERIELAALGAMPPAGLLAASEFNRWYHLGLLALTAVALFFARDERRLLLIIGTPLYALIVHTLTLPMNRYFLPAMPCIVIAAAYAAVQSWSRLSLRSSN